MNTIFDYQARRIERMAESLAYFVASTPPDQLDWQPATGPASQTRSILAMVDECARGNRYVAALLRGESPTPPAAGAAHPFAGGDEARAELIQSGLELAAAVRGLDEAGLARSYEHWRGQLTGEVLLEAPYRNMAYHAGQVNLIQMLAGDSEFHMPPTWLNN